MPEETSASKPLRVLTFDGGGMRGIYSAAYLGRLIELFSAELGGDTLDLVNSVDLIVGTSTGAIVGCAVAKGQSLPDVVKMYENHGPQIFPQKLGKTLWEILTQLPSRRKHLNDGAVALEVALTEVLEDVTFGEIYEKRHVALAIPAIDLGTAHSWVFKTGHVGGVRDDKIRLVDACLATSAAPIFRSLASFPVGGFGEDLVFADGGLWANNPVLVGMVDALKMDPSRPIEIFSLGTCPLPSGEQVPSDKLDRGFAGWKFGAGAAELSISAQEFAYDNMARLLAVEFEKLGRPIHCLRFPHAAPADHIRPHLDLDATSKEAMNALVTKAKQDALLAKSMCDDTRNADGVRIRRLFEAAASPKSKGKA